MLEPKNEYLFPEQYATNNRRIEPRSILSTTWTPKVCRMIIMLTLSSALGILLHLLFGSRYQRAPIYKMLLESTLRTARILALKKLTEPERLGLRSSGL